MLATGLLACAARIAWAIPGFHINDDASAQKAVQLYADSPDKFRAAAYQAQQDKSLWRLALAAHNYLKQVPGDADRECSFAMAYWGAQQPGWQEDVSPDARHQLSDLYDEAVRDAQDAAKRLPDSVAAHLTYGHYLQYFVPGMQKVPQMLYEYRAAVALRPDLGETHYLLGMAYFGDGDTGAANVDKIIAQLVRAVELDPRQVDSYFYLAGVYDWPSHLDPQKSQHYLDKYLRLEPSQASRPDVKALQADLQRKLGGATVGSRR